MFDLSFSESFFFGYEDRYDTLPSQRPTSVYQAILSMPMNDQIRLAQEVFGYDEETAKIVVDTEAWADEVLDKVRKTNTCDTPTSPVKVFIDANGWWTLDVWAESEEEDD